MVDTWLPAYQPNPDRYGPMPYRKVGQSGLRLPAISLGMWHNFGDDKPFDVQRAILRRAFDIGITHFDLANNYGPPYGSAETNFGRHFQDDFRRYRDELVISSKAGWDMWPGPYGDDGVRATIGEREANDVLIRVAGDFLEATAPTTPAV